MNAKTKRNMKARKARSARTTELPNLPITALVEYMQNTPLSRGLTVSILQHVRDYLDEVSHTVSPLKLMVETYGDDEAVVTIPNVADADKYARGTKTVNAETGETIAVVGVSQQGVMYLSQVPENVFDSIMQLPQKNIMDLLTGMACRVNE